MLALRLRSEKAAFCKMHQSTATMELALLLTTAPRLRLPAEPSATAPRQKMVAACMCLVELSTSKLALSINVGRIAARAAACASVRGPSTCLVARFADAVQITVVECISRELRATPCTCLADRLWATTRRSQVAELRSMVLIRACICGKESIFPAIPAMPAWQRARHAMWN